MHVEEVGLVEQRVRLGRRGLGLRDGLLDVGDDLRLACEVLDQLCVVFVVLPEDLVRV